MSLAVSRALSRASQNPGCELLAGMALEVGQRPGYGEPQFYEDVTGNPYPGEYGERASARRRGTRFENNNHRNNAAPLRQRLGEMFGVDPEAMWVRDFGIEIPGPPATMHAQRIDRVRKILRDQLAGRRVPDLLIQPCFELPILEQPNGSVFVNPDFAFFDPRLASYRLGEEKSFIVRDSIVAKSNLDSSRRQTAVGILAYEAELRRVGLSVPENRTGLFVFATPYGLAPAQPFIDELNAEIEQVRRAMDSLRAAAHRLVELRQDVPIELSQLKDLAGELRVNFRESCVHTCVMESYCSRRNAGSAVILGDQAGRAFGSTRPDELAGLLRARARLQGRELEIVRQMERAAEGLGLTLDQLAARIA
jgi:hypothetical protein